MKLIKTSDIINKTKEEGKRVIAVGTTTCRTWKPLEMMRFIKEGSGWTDIFIYPGYDFKVDALITNFHLPESTLMMLVSALHLEI